MPCHAVLLARREPLSLSVNPISHIPPSFFSSNSLPVFRFINPTAHRSNKSSSSSSSQPFRRATTIFSSSLFSATAARRSLSWASVTFWRSWPVRASVMSRFSISAARDALTSRMRPSRSAASGCRIWLRIDWRASAVRVRYYC